MGPNLQSGAGFKELFIKKLSYSIFCSVLSNIVVVFVYIILTNFNVNPVIWFQSSLGTVTKWSTWLYLLGFVVVIIAEIMVCAHNYVLRPPLRTNRFQKFISIFSVRTLISVPLHVVIGVFVVWLYLSLTDGPYGVLYTKCKGEQFCLNEGNFFILLGGIWTGFFYFARTNMIKSNFLFPIIQQRKLLYFKAKFLLIFNNSRKAAFYPIIYYFIAYHIFGPQLLQKVASNFNFGVSLEESYTWMYFYTCLFSVLYVFNMNLLQFFFELYLMEPIQHPILPRYENDTTLSDALCLNVPILQHLACLDLYLLSNWSSERRSMLYTLSQPGGHPYTWNKLFQITMQLVQNFNNTLNKPIMLLTKEEEPFFKWDILGKTVNVINDPIVSPNKYNNIRNMYLMQNETRLNKITSTEERILNLAFKEKLKMKFYEIRIIKYIFGELPEAHVQHCFKNGQLIIWIAQGLANIAATSIMEDPYGIVQGDVAVLTITLLELKKTIQKLNKLPIFTRKNSNVDDITLKMKDAVNSAIDRSLCNICKTFGKFMPDLHLGKDVIRELQHYL